jgi:DNA-binding transcriptional ArsR family regulator
MDNPEELVEEYFHRMLEREKDRQNLIMTVEKQLEVFRNVVKMLLELDSTSEEKEFFKSIILDTNKKLLEYTKSLYGGDDKHTVDTLVDSLATHALLDRKGRHQNEIGFINDFVLGTFIGQIIIDPHIDKIEKTYSAYMIELAVTAYRVQSKKNKAILWTKIQDILGKFQGEAIFSFDIYLKESLVRNYSELSIFDLSFFNIRFENFKVSSSVFVNCYFKNCIFEIECLHGVSFINCTFSNCTVKDGEHIDGKNEVTAIKCTQEKCSILIEDVTQFELDKPSLVNDLEKEILSKVWNISNTKGHHIVKLTGCFDKNKREIYGHLKSLEEKGLIDIRGIHVYFITNKIPLVKEILGITNDI